MTESELLECIMELEDSFGSDLSNKQKEIWMRRFRGYKFSDFKRAVENLIQNREYFPKIASVYKALNDIGAVTERERKEQPKKWRVVKPHVFYLDQHGCRSVLCNETGIDNDPPEKIEKEDGRILTKLL